MNDEKSLQEYIYQIVTRKFIPYGQLTLFKALYLADGKWVSKPQLSSLIRENDEVSLTGVFGALGGRVNQTKGLPPEYKIGSQLLIDKRRVKGGLEYRMKPELRAVLDSIPGMADIFSLSNQEILEKKNNSWKDTWKAQRKDLGI